MKTEKIYQVKKYKLVNNCEGWHWINCSKSTYYRNEEGYRRII